LFILGVKNKDFATLGVKTGKINKKYIKMNIIKKIFKMTGVIALG